MIKHSVTLDGHNTSISMEEIFWIELKKIAQKQKISLNKLIKKIDEDNSRTDGLSSALRQYILSYIKKEEVKMEVLQAINTRRSIRKYKSDEIKETEIKEILNAAMHAPSAGNQQSWEFIVVTDREKLKEIASVKQYAKMAAGAPLALIICARTTNLAHPNFYEQDCSAATQNALLAAHGLGIGAVWVGINYDKNEDKSFRELFNIPDDINPVSCIIFGYPDEVKEPAERFDKNKIKYNTWK
jgi:nitroreductase